MPTTKNRSRQPAAHSTRLSHPGAAATRVWVAGSASQAGVSNAVAAKHAGPALRAHAGFARLGKDGSSCSGGGAPAPALALTAHARESASHAAALAGGGSMRWRREWAAAAGRGETDAVSETASGAAIGAGARVGGC